MVVLQMLKQFMETAPGKSHHVFNAPGNSQNVQASRFRIPCEPASIQLLAMTLHEHYLCLKLRGRPLICMELCHLGQET